MQKRRTFLKRSAKIAGGLVVGALGMGASSIFASQNLTAKNSLNSQEVKMQNIILNNGVKMPVLGLGTYSLRGSEGEAVMGEAIEVGYRLIDTAQMYQNEAEVGMAVANSGLKRREFFITTKLLDAGSESQTKQSIESSLKALKTDYIDLLLLHRNYDKAELMYKVMEDYYKQGILKSIGVSNFKPAVYESFVKTCEIIPQINQCQTHIFYQQKELRKIMQTQGTRLESWSPFVAGKNNFFGDPTLVKLAQKYNKSVAQIALRFLIQQDIIVIPRTSKVHRLKENISVFDFSLEEADMKTLLAMDTNKSSFGWDS